MDKMSRKVTPRVNQPKTPIRRIDVVSGATTADHPVSAEDEALILSALKAALRDAKHPRD